MPDHKDETGLQYSAVGIWEVARQLDFGSFSRSAIFPRCASLEIAFFANGKHRDQKHGVTEGEFHPEFFAFQRHTPTGAMYDRCRSLHIDSLVDIACLLDRAYGGTTLVIHCPGNWELDQTIAPERLKSIVYFPPHMLAEYPQLEAVVAKIVQLFIEHAGMLGALRWQKAARNLSCSMTGKSSSFEEPQDMLAVPLIPSYDISTTKLTFQGRPAGSLDDTVESIQDRFADKQRHQSDHRNHLFSLESETHSTESLTPCSLFTPTLSSDVHIRCTTSDHGDVLRENEADNMRGPRESNVGQKRKRKAAAEEFEVIDHLKIQSTHRSADRTSTNLEQIYDSGDGHGEGDGEEPLTQPEVDIGDHTWDFIRTKHLQQKWGEYFHDIAILDVDEWYGRLRSTQGALDAARAMIAMAKDIGLYKQSEDLDEGGSE